MVVLEVGALPHLASAVILAIVAINTPPLCITTTVSWPLLYMDTYTQHHILQRANGISRLSQYHSHTHKCAHSNPWAKTTQPIYHTFGARYLSRNFESTHGNVLQCTLLMFESALEWAGLKLCLGYRNPKVTI